MNPYTAIHPHHSSKYLTLKRDARCAGCVDYSGASPGGRVKIPVGAQVIRATLNSGMPTERNQTFHIDCYFAAVDEAARQLLDTTAWKAKRLEKQIKTLSERDFAFDDIPF